jgi:hypothetical protein
VGLVLLVRALEPDGRTAGWAVAELALFVVAVAVATLVIERRLLREMTGYLRSRAPEPTPA